MAQKDSIKPIDVQTIKKYQDACNDLLSMQKGGFIYSSDIVAIISKHKASTNLSTALKRLGYTKKVSKGKYQVVLQKYEPINARNVVNGLKEIQNAFQDRKKNGESIRAPYKKKEVFIDPVSVFTEPIPEPVVKIHKKSGTIEVKKKAFVKAKSKIKVKPVNQPDKTTKKVSILWGLISWTKTVNA